jgi:hypothetical protein
MSERPEGQGTLEGAAITASIEEKDAARGKVRHLHPVETGELDPAGPQTFAAALERIAELEVNIEGLEEAHRSAMAKVRLLRRDKDAQAREDALWPLAIEAFTYWQGATGHGRSEWNTARFELVKPYLKSPGIEVVKLAIDGAAHEPYRASKPNKNGHVEVYDSWETIFKNRGSFERHVNRAPRERLREVRDAGAMPVLDHYSLRVKAEVILTLELSDDPRPMPERVDEALRRARLELETRRTDRVTSRPTPKEEDDA